MKKMLLFAIFTVPFGAQIFSVDIGGVKMSLFRMTIIFTLFAFLCTNARGKRKFIIFNDNTKYSVLFMLIWFAYAIFSIFWCADLSNYIRVLFFLFIGVISIILLLNYFKTTDDIVAGFQAFALGISVQSLIGWYEIFTRDYRFIEYTEHNIRQYIDSPQRIPIAATGNPNNFATLMFFGVFCAYLCATYTKTGKLKRIINYSLSANFCILLVMTTSRACILGFLFSLAILLFVLKKGKWVILLFGCAVALFIPNIIDFISEQLKFNFDIDYNSEAIRVNLLQNGLVFLGDTLGFGVGNGQIEYWMSHNAEYQTGGITNMHNWWMEILTSYGIGIFIGYLIFYCRLFFDNYRNIKKSIQAENRVISLNIVAIMAGFIIASMSSSSNMTNEWTWVFWAMCIAYQRMIKRSKGLVKQ